MFSRVSHVKTDWKSRLSRTNLDVLLRINEEGPDVANFDAEEVLIIGFATAWEDSPHRLIDILKNENV